MTALIFIVGTLLLGTIIYFLTNDQRSIDEKFTAHVIYLHNSDQLAVVHREKYEAISGQAYTYLGEL